MIQNPFEQFKIFYFSSNLDNINTTLTNAILLNLLFCISYYILTFFILKNEKNIYKFDISIILFREIYKFVYSSMSNYLKTPHLNRYFPFFLYLFLFILFSNLVGLIPYSFTTTSHFVFTFSLSFIVWFAIFLIAIERWGIRLASFFFPKSISIILVLFLNVIELISYLFRMVSLSLRLTANMIAGHILLDCLSFFIYKIFFSNFVGLSFNIVSLFILVIPFFLLLILFIFELVVCFLQAYIFFLLAIIYLNEIL